MQVTAPAGAPSRKSEKVPLTSAQHAGLPDIQSNTAAWLTTLHMKISMGRMPESFWSLLPLPLVKLVKPRCIRSSSSLAACRHGAEVSHRSQTADESLCNTTLITALDRLPVSIANRGHVIWLESGPEPAGRLHRQQLLPPLPPSEQLCSLL